MLYTWIHSSHVLSLHDSESSRPWPCGWWWFVATVILARPTKASQHRIFLLATERRSHYLQPQAAQCIMFYSGDVHSRRRCEKYGCCLARYNEFPTLEQTCMNLSGSQEHCHLVPHYLRGAQEYRRFCGSMGNIAPCQRQTNVAMTRAELTFRSHLCLATLSLTASHGIWRT